MDIVACGTTFDPRSAVFVEVRAFLIRVAFEAGFVLETAQAFSRGWNMRIMAVRAVHNSLLESVALVELELGENFLVANITGFCLIKLEE
jgi:hypothetical protein